MASSFDDDFHDYLIKRISQFLGSVDLAPFRFPYYLIKRISQFLGSVDLPPFRFRKLGNIMQIICTPHIAAKVSEKIYAVKRKLHDCKISVNKLMITSNIMKLFTTNMLSPVCQSNVLWINPSKCFTKKFLTQKILIITVIYIWQSICIIKQDKRTTKEKEAKIMFRKPYLLLLVVAVMSLLAQPAMADSLLFSNGSLDGTNIGTVNSAEITGSGAVTDSFLISTTSNLTSITFGAWTYHSGDLATIDFIIKDAYGNIMAQGNDVSVTDTNETKNLYNFYVSDATFNLSAQLAAGTYYLTLTDAKDTSGSFTFWDMNSASSSSASNASGSIPSEYFSIDGNTSTVVPEPTTMLLFGLGLAGLAGVRRFKK